MKERNERKCVCERENKKRDSNKCKVYNSAVDTIFPLSLPPSLLLVWRWFHKCEPLCFSLSFSYVFLSSLMLGVVGFFGLDTRGECFPLSSGKKTVALHCRPNDQLTLRFWMVMSDHFLSLTISLEKKQKTK